MSAEGFAASVDLNDLTSLQWRPATRDDLPELLDLLAAISAFDDVNQRWGLADLQERQAHAEAGEDGPVMVGFDRGSLVAAGWNSTFGGPNAGTRLTGTVHPAFRHQGIGRALLRWQLGQARSWHAAHHTGQDFRVIGFTDAELTGKRTLYELFGLRPTRWFIDMVCEFPPQKRVDDYLLTPALSLHFHPLTPDLVEATREAHNEVFAHRFGSQALGSEEWARSLAREGARPDLSWVAIDEFRRVIGYALNSVVRTPGMPDLGWTDRLGVRPSHRGRNIARILLARSLDLFRQSGMDAGGIGVDSVDGGGTSLYRSLGYEATDTIIQYELVEPSVTKGEE